MHTPLDVSNGWVGPQVNKFEKISSDDHQMSVAGEGVGLQGGGKLNELMSLTELSFSHSYQSKLSKTGSNRVNYVCTCPVQSLHMLS